MSDKILAPAADAKPANPLASPSFAKFFKIWLFSLVALLAFQTIFPAKTPTSAAAVGAVTVKVTNASDPSWIGKLFGAVPGVLSVPHLPALTVTNASGTGVAFDTCKDLSFVVNGVAVNDLPMPCKAVTVAASGGTYAFAETDKGDFVALAKYFQVPASWEFRLSAGGKTLSAKAELVQPGAFKSFFLAFFYEPIYNLFVFLIGHMPGLNLGWAIVLLTLIVRVILLYPQHQMMVANRKMQAIQPKIKELQAKHKDDQQAMGAALMKLYKEEKANPLGSCLPLVIQTPILIMLYWAILEIDHVVNTFYLYGFVGAFDPSVVDTRFFGLDLTASHNVGSFVLAVVSAAAQYAQVALSQALNKKPDAPKEMKDANMPDMAQMMKVMLYALPLMVGASTFVFPAGVGVYWFVGTLFVTAQQLVVNRLAKAREAKAAPAA